MSQQILVLIVFLQIISFVIDKRHCAASGIQVLVAMTSARRRDDVTAARYRLRQLVRQHPPHDSVVRHCTSLKDDGEQAELVEFDRQRRLRHLGRAEFFTVSKDDASSTTTRCRQVRRPVPYQSDVLVSRRTFKQCPHLNEDASSFRAVGETLVSSYLIQQK